MSNRLQTVNGDTVLEITETEQVKHRLSEKRLLARKEYLTLSINRFQDQLDDTEAKLALIYAERNKA